VSSIDSRLRRLEERGRGGRCPECGLPPEGPGYIVLIDEIRPEESFEGDPEERCGRCGRPLYQVIRVVYDAAEGPDAA
jgi:DNA-directed RNA polymerase subunit RPC12/RpoP